VRGHPVGFHYAAIRRPILNVETHDYVRTTIFIAPFTVLIPPNDQYNLAQMLVPIDDVNCMFYWIAWHPRRASPGRLAQVLRGRGGRRSGRRLPQAPERRQRYGQDRAQMKAGDFTGIEGIPTQDMAMWESMGPIADRSADHLGVSDVAISSSAARWSPRQRPSPPASPRSGRPNRGHPRPTWLPSRASCPRAPTGAP
jgi:phthalate 4,5-dioxygenase oxygenase subunit